MNRMPYSCDAGSELFYCSAAEHVSALRYCSLQQDSIQGSNWHTCWSYHLYLLGLLDSPLCRRCEMMEKSSAPILWECEALASLRHAYLGSFLTFICLSATTLSCDVAHRTIRSWRQNSFDCFSRWPWNTLRNYMCGVSLVAGRSGGSPIRWSAWSADW
jgi:hypothetical protein